MGKLHPTLLADVQKGLEFAEFGETASQEIVDNILDRLQNAIILISPENPEDPEFIMVQSLMSLVNILKGSLANADEDGSSELYDETLQKIMSMEPVP